VQVPLSHWPLQQLAPLVQAALSAVQAGMLHTPSTQVPEQHSVAEAHAEPRFTQLPESPLVLLLLLLLELVVPPAAPPLPLLELLLLAPPPLPPTAVVVPVPLSPQPAAADATTTGAERRKSTAIFAIARIRAPFAGARSEARAPDGGTEAAPPRRVRSRTGRLRRESRSLHHVQRRFPWSLRLPDFVRRGLLTSKRIEDFVRRPLCSTLGVPTFVQRPLRADF
jgi:hypothetical protein